MTPRWPGFALVLALTTSAGTCERSASDPRAGSGPHPFPRLDIAAFCTATFDPGEREFVYEYSVLNLSSSEGVVDLIGLRHVGPRDSVQTPRGWMPLVGGFQGEARALVWGSVGDDKRIPTDLDFMRYPMNTAVYPGERATGFRLRSHEPAETTGFVVEPFVSDVVDSEDELPGPFTYIPSVWELHLVGTIDAPRAARATGSTPTDATRPPATRASYTLSKRGHARIDVIDGLGKPVSVLLDRVLSPGSGVVTWQSRAVRGTPAARGNLYARMTLDGQTVGRHEVFLAR